MTTGAAVKLKNRIHLKLTIIDAACSCGSLAYHLSIFHSESLSSSAIDPRDDLVEN